MELEKNWSLGENMSKASVSSYLTLINSLLFPSFPPPVMKSTNHHFSGSSLIVKYSFIFIHYLYMLKILQYFVIVLQSCFGRILPLTQTFLKMEWYCIIVLIIITSNVSLQMSNTIFSLFVLILFLRKMLSFVGVQFIKEEMFRLPQKSHHQSWRNMLK